MTFIPVSLQGTPRKFEALCLLKRGGRAKWWGTSNLPSSCPCRPQRACRRRKKMAPSIQCMVPAAGQSLAPLPPSHPLPQSESRGMGQEKTGNLIQKQRTSGPIWFLLKTLLLDPLASIRQRVTTSCVSQHQYSRVRALSMLA